MKSWTKAQKDAICARGGPLLVGAAAGSGKTAVLVERVLSLICDEQEPVEANRLLIVTYTNAAAAEMKQRIAQRISEVLQERPGDLRLLKQRALLGQAAIGTIHSFCWELVRQNFQHLPVGQDFVLAGGGELEILRQESAREVVEEFYAENSSEFSNLVELLSTGRDDRRLVETMLRLFDFARSHPFYERWLDETQALYHTEHNLEDTLWGKALTAYGDDTLRYCIASLEEAHRVVLTDEAAAGAYGDALAGDIRQLRECREMLCHDWDKTVDMLRGVVFGRLGQLRGHEEIKARVKPVRERCRRLMQELTEKILNAHRADFAADMADLRPTIAVLFDMVRAYSKAFAAAKQRKKRLDFSDLEHFALGLLVEVSPDGGWRRTERAASLSSRYDAVLVDEFQDVSEVQNLIFSSVSRMEQNLFMVGDAKQSIYSFRLATPEIFLKRGEGSFPYDENTRQFPAKITLDQNFRSRGDVLNGVNFLFSLLMSKRMGDIDYGGGELLMPGKVFPESGDAAPEFLLLDASAYEGEENSACLEAEMVAGRIASMIETGYQVADGEGMRPCRPGDFCLLMRSRKKRMQVFVAALEKMGLPVWAQNEDKFLTLREVSMILSFMRAMDNPLRDIPLVGALLSPLFGFSDRDVAAIRLAGQGMPFYRALQRAAEGECADLALSARCLRFLTLFSELRRRAAVLSADRLLIELYARTDALAVAQAMPAGETRRANLLLLIEYAAEYHSLGYKRLSGFVAFLDRLEERGGDISPAGTTGESQDTVKVMSVHRSKGLEFPIVFLVDTASRFNLTDVQQATQIHSTYGFACMRRDPETMKQFPTIPMQAIRIEGRRSTLGEELRVLYVALTRAREKLVVAACPQGSIDKRLAALAGETTGGKLSPRAVEEARCTADWMMMALLHHPGGLPLRERGGCMGLDIVEHSAGWQVQILHPQEKGASEDLSRPLCREHPPDRQLLGRLKERGAWVYPHENRTRIPAKLAVSAVSKGEQAAGYRFARRPRFLSDRGLTAAERGNAMHRFMQFANYEHARQNLSAEIARMSEKKFLTWAEAESLDRKRLRNFFAGKLASRIFAADIVFRELRFVGECGREVLGDMLEGMDSTSRVALQGVADCVFFEAGKAIIVDYKTDFVKSPQELTDRYAGQLTLYRAILSQALEAPVAECLIYSFSLGQEILVK